MRNTALGRSPTLLVVVGLTVLACDGLPTLPEGSDRALSSSALGRDGGTVTVPMKVDASMMWTVPGATAADCPELIDPSTGELFIAEGSGEGEATHLGRFEITELDHPTINVCPPGPPGPADLLRHGTFQFVAADGSTISGSYSFLFVPPEDGGFFTLFVEDGTGRLDGASGELEFVFDESGMTQSQDPLFLTRATLDPAVFEGEVTIPRP